MRKGLKGTLNQKCALQTQTMNLKRKCWRTSAARPKSFKVFHMLNVCLSMSKYPLGSNLGETGVGTGGLGWGLGLGFRL